MSDIIKAQQGLARKAQTDQKHQFDDLYFLLCKQEWLEEALQHVLTNDGALTSGIDGISWKDFNDLEKSDFENEQYRRKFIDNLQAELKAKTFKPSPVRRVEIPKPGTDKKRPLGIMTIKDRVVQTVLKMVLEPIWESDFYYFSNGFRPARCTMDCVQPLYQLCGTKNRYRWVIEGDIRACFDSISENKLLEEVVRRIADKKILKLITSFLKSGIIQRGSFVPSEKGISQGGPLSPLLANIFLHRFDEWYSQNYAAPDDETNRKGYEAWKRERTKGGAKAATQMFRFADDWIILVRGTKSQAQCIKEECKKFLWEELGLELSEEKTKITHISQGFDFLGYHIFRNSQPKDGRLVGVFSHPTRKGLAQVKLKIKQMTDRSTLWDDYLSKLKAINAVVRGWSNYYRAVNPAAVFEKLDRYVWLRLRRWLAKKYQLSARQVKRQYMYHYPGPKGGSFDFAAQDEEGKWVWRYRAVQTKLIYYRPSFKKHWPNPYLQKVKVEHYALPTLKKMWSGNTPAANYTATRRVALKRAKGTCERCGKPAKLFVHHKHRVKTGRRKLEQADNRAEMLEVLCFECHTKEHRAENIYRGKLSKRKSKLKG